MPGSDIQLEYTNVLTDRVGAAHGLSRSELRAATAKTKAIITSIEKSRKHGEHRYHDLPHDKKMVAAVTKAVRERKDKYDNLVVLGIGGSALGNIALQSALNPPLYNLLPANQRKGPRLFVMDNVDPVQFSALLDVLGTGIRKTLFNVISKSGETAETAAQFLIVRDMLAKKISAKKMREQILVTTDPAQGTMREIVDAAGFDALLVPEGVGGRFSVLSAVGLFSAAMCGINIKQLLAGAATMSDRAAEKNVFKNPAALLALLLYEFYARGKRTHVMMPYSNQLRDLADWYRQLWAESLGKRESRDGREVYVGPTPIMALGATDQHSQVQLYREGPNDKVFIFLEVEKFAKDVKIPRDAATPQPLKYLQGASLGKLLNAEKLATEFALVESQRPCMTIRFPKIDAHAVGQFIMLWEAATSIAGGLFGINPYDQPAVQRGKVLTFALMGNKDFADERAALEKKMSSTKRALV